MAGEINYNLDFWIENKYRLLSQYEKNQKKLDKILDLMTKKFELLLQSGGCR